MLKTLVKHISGIALTWVVVLMGTFFLLRWYSQPSSEREVPELAGMSKQQAEETLLDLGLIAVWQDSVYSPNGTPGAVVEQHPPSGSAVKAGRKILMTTYRISPPSEGIGVEEGQDAKLAERLLTTRGFKVEVTEEANSLLAGKVIRVEHRGDRVGADESFPKGTSLVLVVGAMGDKDVRVPWLMGLSLDDARGVLSRRKLALGHVGYADDVVTALDSSLAVVVSQDASPGTTPYVREGSAIDLYLGKH